MARNRQRGIMLYGALAALLAFAGVSAYAYVQSSRLASCKQEYARFQADVQAKGEAAAREAARIDAENARRKEKSDAERKRLLTINAGLADRLRDSRSGRGYVPEPAPGSASPDRAAFNRTELDAALRRLDAGVSGLIAEGDAARIGLDTAREWAQR